VLASCRSLGGRQSGVRDAGPEARAVNAHGFGVFGALGGGGGDLLTQQLGADGFGKLPVTGEDGKVVPETAGPEVRAADLQVSVLGGGVFRDAARRAVESLIMQEKTALSCQIQRHWKQKPKVGLAGKTSSRAEAHLSCSLVCTGALQGALHPPISGLVPLAGVCCCTGQHTRLGTKQRC
jgi:hypothetical protein